MDHFIPNLTYGLIATSCTVLFVCGSALVLFPSISLLINKRSLGTQWQSALGHFGLVLTGIAAIAIALHFTL